MRAKKEFSNKKILITGASTGIGEATALEFARQGADIVINYHQNLDEAKDTKARATQICKKLKDINCKYMMIQADVSDEKQVKNMFERIFDKWGRLDILINNAGIQQKNPSDQVSLKDFMKIIRVNLIGTLLCSQNMIRHLLLRSDKGVIVNNTSVHQKIPKPQYLSYSVSKGALENLTQTLALEYADKNIRINSVAPGAVETPINPWSGKPKKKENISEHIPMGKVAQPEQIAKVISFLASEDSSYITGQTIFVDGGLVLYPQFRKDWSSS